ncbi:hypothetical protein R3P38DRAFT_1656531 [Favolaschia claudopus]|uniref:Nephrocystin 3-like N-terminal domain-containing protein n=1 Tax=Favolaschia claudopus TaxID=2862362 RepID=A0AAW0AEZ2_9AGAR
MYNFRMRRRSGGTKTDPLPEYLSVLKDGFALLIDRTERCLDGTPFKIPISVINTALKLANDISDNKNDLQLLCQNIACQLAIVNGNLTQPESTESRDLIARFSRELKQELDAVGALANRGILRRILKTDADARAIADAFRRIDNRLNVFHLSLSIEINRKLDCANVEAALVKLYEASSNEASYDWGNNYDRPSCHPKTREEYLSQLEAWSQEKPWNRPGIFWMYGPAGTGKSAIVQSFCEQLHCKDQLGASFFFKRDHPSRSNAMKVFPTLAYHLATVSPELRVAIASSIREDPAVFSKSLAIQLQKLIVSPCQTATLALPLVIAIDGLDECKGEESQQEILHCLRTAYDDLKSQLLILIASRPEPEIRSIFEETHLMFAQNLEIHGSQDDVRTYLVDEFQRIRETYQSLHAAPMSWPGNDVVERYVEQSSGHFVYASTVVRFIDDKDWNPEERLRVIRKIETQPPFSTSPFSTLDQLYTGILADVPNRPRLLRILTLIAAGLQLSLVHIGQLLELERTDIRTTLRRLHSLIYIPPTVGGEEDMDDYITVHHASFLDFLNDPARSTQFHFNSAARHSLALHILKVFSEPSEIGSLLAGEHVFWSLHFEFITTTYLSPDMIHSLRQINLDLLFVRRGFGEISKWLEQQNAPVDLTRQWGGYATIADLEEVLALHFSQPRSKQDVDYSIPEALEIQVVSPTLVRIIQTWILIRATSSMSSHRNLIITRWVLDYSWDEMQTAIAPICFLKGESDIRYLCCDIRYLCWKISSPARIQELHLDQTLQILAKRCIQVICLQLQRRKAWWETSIHIVRVCSPTIELLEAVLRLVTTENLEYLSKEYSIHIHNIVVWLEAHPDAPLHLVERVKAFAKPEYFKHCDAKWKKWKKYTGLEGSRS